ncbi:MAG: ketosteroid isomerase [Acidimicrobiia bacterium]
MRVDAQALRRDSSTTHPDDLESVRRWVSDWGAEVAALELVAARRRFVADVVAFGTRADVVVGIDRLFDEQWSRVWPTIEDFRFEVGELEAQVSPDRLQAVAIVGWSSTGIHADGARFDRPGRATIVLQRSATGAPWIGTHTHFSLGLGVPQTSHGARLT